MAHNIVQRWADFVVFVVEPSGFTPVTSELITM